MEGEALEEKDKMGAELREMAKDRNLIYSIPKRLQAVIDVDKRQIPKEDY